MDRKTGRPNHIEDALITINKGTWFEWTNSKDKVYANLQLSEFISKEVSPDVFQLVVNPYTLPTEKELTDKLTELQAAWDLENDSYKSKRRAEYPSIEDQLDDIYHNGIDGWKTTIKTTKDKYTKE